MGQSQPRAQDLVKYVLTTVISSNKLLSNFLVVRHSRQSFHPATHTLVCSILFYSLFLKCLTHKISRSLRQHSTVWKTPTWPPFWKPRMCLWSDPTPRSGLRIEGNNLQVALASTLAGQWPSFWQVGQLSLNDAVQTRTIKRPPAIQRFTQEQYCITSFTCQHDGGNAKKKKEVFQKSLPNNWKIILKNT